LVITHDHHYFHLADGIVKLDYGKLEYDRHTSIILKYSSSEHAVSVDTPAIAGNAIRNTSETNNGELLLGKWLAALKFTALYRFP